MSGAYSVLDEADEFRTRRKEEGSLCVECGRPVEPQRECYVFPTCYACLPPPEPLPFIEPFVQPKPLPASKPCEHGLVPWWDCAVCRATSHYGFSGNFR